ncbi:site-specific integrase [Pseudogemmobacter humi]|uniref:DUF6538 domain-containing protein n=1 Tax=Pseudogemmobacter humi TaxID=2483812 RepID=A0A3P5WLE3_9RHOB|nr:site-specific integrase [Pseudogemmobacter humi]VDC24363.1 hypothetical protein XINFAN_01199 [Pseudogemmobacter humi]
MKIVAETHHLQKRGSIWHYYRRVPLPLVPFIGRAFIKKSLGVSDLKQAKVLRNALNVKVDAQFAAAEQALASPGKTGDVAPVSLVVLTEHLRSHIERIDRRSAQRLLSDPPDSEEQRSEMRMDAEITAQILRNRDDPRASEWVLSTSNAVLAEAKAPLVSEMTVAQFEETVRRGLLELATRRIYRLDDAYDRTHHDPLFDPQRAPSVTFGELADIFWAERLQSYETNGVNQKRIDKVKAELSFIREAVGDNIPLSTVNDDTVQYVRGLLASLPANRRKYYPKLDITQAIEQGKKDGKRVIDPVTQARYLDCLRDILTVGVRKQYLRGNPALGIKPIKKSKTPASAKRAPLSVEQITDFFNGTFYRSFAAGAPKPYVKRDRAWRFWLPLVMAFSGARPKEIAQLMWADVQQTPNGTWYLNVIETDDEDGEAPSEGIGGKTVKTESSRRRIPVHPELVHIGFLGFVNQQKKKAGHKNARLFPGLKPDHYGNVATYANRRFNEVFLPTEITLAKNQVFYSFRHSVRDAMRRVKVPSETLLAVTGWSPAGKAVSDDYGDAGNPDLHIEWVEKIHYPGLDLSFLYGAGTNV